MTPPVWIVPLEPGPVAKDGPRIEIKVTEELEVDVQRFAGGAVVPLCPLPSTAACLLGSMLHEASAWAGREQARRDARKGRAR